MSEAIEQVIKQLKTRAAVVVHAEPEVYVDHLWAIVDDIIPHPEEGSPRAIIVCASDEEARHIEAYFQKAAKAKDLTVDLVVEMAVYNPFDFFLEPAAENFPFSYQAELKHDLAPYLVAGELTPLLKAYVASGEPMGKAGAYGVQGLAAAHISVIKGSYTGIMGLPLFETAELLQQI